MQSGAFPRIWKSCAGVRSDAGGGVVRTAAQGQDLKSFEQRITTKVLPNGLTLIVCERPRRRCSASRRLLMRAM